MNVQNVSQLLIFLINRNENFSNFKCSVCMHMYGKSIKKNPKCELDTKKLANGYSYIVILNLVILILGLLH